MGRKLTAGLMSAVRAGKTEPLQEYEAMVTVVNLLENGGKNWYQDMNRRDFPSVPLSTIAHSADRVAASMVLAAGFGLHCPTGEEPDLKEVIEASLIVCCFRLMADRASILLLQCIAEFVALCTPSASIINVLPFLDAIPGPMPWRKRAQAYRKREDALYAKLIKEAVSGKASGMNTYVIHWW